MSPKHTPGPWRVFLETEDRAMEIWWKIAEVQDGGGNKASYLVCGEADKVDEGGTAEADARLIAAAPELLAACKSWLRDRSTCPMPNGRDLESWELMAEAVRKAEGR